MGLTLHELDAEWERLARSADAARRLRGWTLRYPVFAGLASFDDVLDRRRDVRYAQPVLRALAEMAAGDWLAARTMLQALFPGLVCLARRSGSDDPAAIDELLSLAWERIRTYPVCRPGSVAANVLFDVRKRYRHHRTIEAPRSSQLPASVADESPTPEEAFLAAERRREFANVWREGVISDDIAGLILRTRLEGQSLASAAAEAGASSHAMNLRRWRAECRLRRRLAGVY